MAATFTEDVDIKRILDTLANARTKLTVGKVQILTDEKNEQIWRVGNLLLFPLMAKYYDLDTSTWTLITPLDCTVVDSYPEVGIPSVNVIASVMGKNSSRLLSVCEDIAGGIYGPTERRDIAVITNPDNAASMTDTRTALAISQVAYDATSPAPHVAARFVAGTEGDWKESDDSTINSYAAIETVKNKVSQQQVKINSDGEMFVEGASKQVACGGGITSAPVTASMAVTVEIAGHPYHVNVAPVV